jgi:hypothetical protein
MQTIEELVLDNIVSSLNLATGLTTRCHDNSQEDTSKSCDNQDVLFLRSYVENNAILLPSQISDYNRDDHNEGLKDFQLPLH